MTYDISVRKSAYRPARRVGALALAAIMACSLSFPQFAFAAVRIDQTELAQGANVVGGGTATLADSNLDMVGVTAGELYTDEDLSVHFNGGNDVENVNVAGSAKVDLSFSGCNDVEEVHAADESDVTINANGHNEFEEIEATNQSNITINVNGTNEFEEIVGSDDANIIIRGTSCQKRDIINLGDGEKDTALWTERGTLTIDHATINLEAVEALIGSEKGNVSIYTSKIAKGDDNEYTRITAGGTMQICESVIDITGTVYSKDAMTITHSNVKATAPDLKFGDTSPYRLYSETGIKLNDEKNGEVEKGSIDGKTVWYVDTDDNDGKDVDLKADGEPAYYRCASGEPTQVKAAPKTLPKTSDAADLALPLLAGAASMAVAAYATRRREEQ